MGRLSSSRSSAWEGKKPTYVSVFALMSTYEAVLHKEAAFDGQSMRRHPSQLVLTQIPSDASRLHGEQRLWLRFLRLSGGAVSLESGTVRPAGLCTDSRCLDLWRGGPRALRFR